MNQNIAAIAAEAMATAREALEAFGDPQSADDLYRDGRELIDQGQFDRAIAEFRKLAERAQTRADGALYWIAYAQNKLNQRADALSTLADLQRRFASSRWARDGKALEVEIRQASGQRVSPDVENDDDLKLLVLTNMSHSDPTRTLAALEPLLSSDKSSAKVKDRALFVLSQMQDPKAHDILAKTAKDAGHPDLQARAVRYLGMAGGDANRQLLADVYQTTSDVTVKRSVLRSLMLAQDHARLLTVAKTESSPDLRGEAIQQLGVMHAAGELKDLYRTESSPELKKRIMQAMFVGGDAEELIELSKTEKNPELRRTAVRNLGLMDQRRTGDTLVSMYTSDSGPEVKHAVIDALFVQNNAHALVGLARNEKNAELKKAIVSKLSVMHSKEATDYLMELLK